MRFHLLERIVQRLPVRRHHGASKGFQELAIVALGGVKKAGLANLAPEARFRGRQNQRERMQPLRRRQRLRMLLESARQPRVITSV
jgi:hypothetical protein